MIFSSSAEDWKWLCDNKDRPFRTEMRMAIVMLRCSSLNVHPKMALVTRCGAFSMKGSLIFGY